MPGEHYLPNSIVPNVKFGGEEYNGMGMLFRVWPLTFCEINS